MHPRKRYCQEVKKGVEFLGARIYPHCLYPGDRLQKNFRKAALEVAKGQKDIENLVSYLGIMIHLDGEKFQEMVFDEYGWRGGGKRVAETKPKTEMRKLLS